MIYESYFADSLEDFLLLEMYAPNGISRWQEFVIYWFCKHAGLSVPTLRGSRIDILTDRNKGTLSLWYAIAPNYDIMVEAKTPTLGHYGEPSWDGADLKEYGRGYLLLMWDLHPYLKQFK